MIDNLLSELLKITWETTGNIEKLVRPKSKSDLSALPSSLRELYSIADGQNEDLTPLFEGYVFVNGKDCIALKRSMDKLSTEEGWDNEWWKESWFPFGDDIAGQYLVVDKNSGKVLEFNHDSPERPILAESLEEYLQNLVRGLKSGVLIYDNELGILSTQEFERYEIESKSWKSTKLGAWFIGLLPWKRPRRLTKRDMLEWTVSIVVVAIFVLLRDHIFK